MTSRDQRSWEYQETERDNGKGSFETNKWTMFLETEATLRYCNWSIKMAWIIGFGSTSVVNSLQRLGRLPFFSLCKG